MQILDFIALCVIFGLTNWAIIDPRFKDGVFLKKGLVCLSLSSFACLVHYVYPELPKGWSQTLLNGSVAFIVMLVALRRLFRPAYGAQ